MWCIPPKHSAEFVYHMEDVLEVYRRPHDPKHPVVCLDETFTQLIGETREPLPTVPGQVERYDCVYVRNGTASLFLAFEPLAGWRHVAVTEGRKRGDWARFVAALLPRPSPRLYGRKLDGEQEARLLALACARPPEGKARWSLRLLAERMVELEHVDTLSHETVRQTLKKTSSSHI